jgi:hypothetical protein
MISIKVQGSVGEPTLILALLFAIALLGSAPLPVLAQASGSWMNTGTLNVPRNGHTATLLENGLVLAWSLTTSMSPGAVYPPLPSC